MPRAPYAVFVVSFFSSGEWKTDREYTSEAAAKRRVTQLIRRDVDVEWHEELR